jgi:hypothetical protein
MQFRNPTLTNGTPVVVPMPATPLSITVPSGASLGTSSGISATLALLVAYNGGSPVLCITYLAVGLSIDETGLISPTTISGGSSSGLIYSASAVAANSPYRVVGFLKITEATAGTWSVGPTAVQGQGGEAFSALQSFGFGQTPQNVTGSRSLGTTFYNTTGKPIAVYVVCSGASVVNAALNFFLNGILCAVGPGAAAAGGAVTIQFVVPADFAYQVAFASGSATLSTWFEVR